MGRSLTAVVVLISLSLSFGCATRTRPKPAPSAPLPTPIAEAPKPTPPTPAPLPAPISIGPRAEEPTRIAPTQPSTTAPSTAPPVSPAQRGKFVVLNFDNADIETVIHAASEIAGFNYVLAPDVRGKVTVQTSGRIAQEDVYGVLLAILEVNGFTAVKSGNLYKIVRIEGARERAVPTIIGGTADPARTDDEIITQILRLRFTPVTDIANLVRPLISSRGAVVAHRETNVLILTDTASNIRRVLDIVGLVDVEVALEDLQIIPIRFADAADLATILNQLFAAGRLTPTPGAPAPVIPTPTVPGAPRPPTAAGETTGAERPPLIIAERRSNSLIVHARKHQLETVRRLIAQLDVNIYGGRRVFIYFAENAKAKDLAATLNAIYSGRETGTGTTGTPPPTAPGRLFGTPPPPPPPPVGGAAGTATGIGEVGLVEGQVRFIADETTNSVIVTTFPRNWPEIEATIKQLDKMPRQVLIEVLVAEISLTDDTRLGIDWALRQGRFSVGSTASNPAIPTSPTAAGGPISAPQSLIPRPNVVGAFGPIAQGLTAFTFDTDRFFAILNTLASLNRINVLSNPHILTAENKKAVINVSTSIPIVTSQQVPLAGTTTTTGTASPTAIGTQSVEYRDTGVILTVTPRIGERGTVALDVKQDVNDIGTATPPTNSLSIIKREAETSVVLVNNQTLVLGGLIRDRTTVDNRGIPFLKDIPILGFFFGFKERKVEKTELLLLITPRVIGTPLDAARVTEQMRRATPELEESIKRAPRIAPPTTPPPPPMPTPPPPSQP